MITGISVFYNGTKVPVKTMKDYASLYQSDNMITIETSDSNVVLASQTKGDGFSSISFVNGIETTQGGIHVDTWSEALLRPVLEKINSTVKKGSNPLTMKDIRPYFRIFLNCKLVNPAFTSQEKAKLVSPNVSNPDSEILPKHINAVMKEKEGIYKD